MKNLFALLFPRPKGLFKLSQLLAVVLVALPAGSARADLDSDGDGLPDEDEIAVHGTNPNVADTDRDGLPDGMELQMGSDPLSATSGLRIRSQQRVSTGWRVCWSSLVGRTYELQRANLAIGSLDGPEWVTVARLTASTISTCFTDRDLTAGAVSYRVRFVADPAGDTQPPLVSAVQATEFSESVRQARLTVSVRDLVGVQRVEFMDGATTIGVATPGANHTYSFNWPVSVNAMGRHYLRARAVDAAGNAGYSPVLAFDVNPESQRSLTIGGLHITADSISTVSGVSTISGRIQMNGIPLASGSQVTATLSSLRGSGGITLPGLGTVFNGQFSVDLSTGVLSALAGTTPTLPALSFSSQLRFLPSALSLNLRDGSLCGNGPIQLQMPNHAYGQATFSGQMCYQPLAGTVTTDGTLRMGPFSATGQSMIQLHNSTLAFSGSGAFNSYSFDPLHIRAVANAVNHSADFEVSGTLRTSHLEPVTFSGTLRTDGSVVLNGQSGPYTAASLGGVVPRLDAANVSFDKKLFAGAYHLFSRVPSLSASFGFQLARTPDSAGGQISLRVTNDVFLSGRHTLRLTGVANLAGEWSVSGGLMVPEATILGYTVSDLDITATRAVSGSVTFRVTRAALAVRGVQAFTQALNGTVSPAGVVDLTWTGSLTLGGFTAEAGRLHLNSANGLQADGEFRLFAANREFGSLTATGSVAADGVFHLRGTTRLNIGGAGTGTGTFDLTVNGVGAAGTLTMNFGTMSVRLFNLRITVANGISCTSSFDADTGWVRMVDLWEDGGGPQGGDIYGRYICSGSLSIAPNGSFTAAGEGTLWGWGVTFPEPPPLDWRTAHADLNFNANSSGYLRLTYQLVGIDLASWEFDLW